MDFTFTPQHVALRRLIREIAEEEIRPRAKKMDRASAPDMELLRIMAEAGLFGVPFPQKYGGMGAGEIGYCILMEEISRVDSSVATIIGAHIGIGAMSLYLGGSEALKKKYLPDLCAGRKIAAFALTEPNAGSDAAGIQLRATLEGDSYFLDGQKMWITNGPIADVVMVLAVTDPALGARGGATVFAVEKGWEGFSAGKPEKKMGLHGSPTHAVTFDEVRVPRENLVGVKGRGLHQTLAVLDGGRIGIGALAVGLAQSAYEAAVKYAHERHTFGVPIAHHQAIQWMLADAATEIEAARLMVYRAAWLKQNKRPYIKEAAQAKLFATEMAERVCRNAIQIHGGYGYSREFPVERLYRDARLMTIGEGSSEIQRLVIARQILNLR